MAASVSGSKTVHTDVAPHLTAATLTTLMGIAPENYTVAQWRQVDDAIKRMPCGDPSVTIGSLLP